MTACQDLDEVLLWLQQHAPTVLDMLVVESVKAMQSSGRGWG